MRRPSAKLRPQRRWRRMTARRTVGSARARRGLWWAATWRTLFHDAACFRASISKTGRGAPPMPPPQPPSPPRAFAPGRGACPGAWGRCGRWPWWCCGRRPWRRCCQGEGEGEGEGEGKGEGEGQGEGEGLMGGVG